MPRAKSKNWKIKDLWELRRSKTAKLFINLGLSLLAAIGFCKVYAIADNPGRYPFNTFMFLVVVGITYIAYKKRNLGLPKSANILAVILAGILSIILVIGRQLEMLSRINWTFGTALSILCLGCLTYIAIYYVVDLVEKIKLKSDFVLTRKAKITIFAVVLASNFLIFLATMPGVYGWDSSLQAYYFLNDQMNTHYSVLLSAVFGGLLGVGKMIFGSFGAGMALAMLLQMIFMSYVYTRIICLVAELTKNKVMTVLTILFFTLSLIMGLATVYATQDIVFGGVFALIFIELFELARNPDYWNNKVNIAKFVGLAFLLCACRNNGIYLLAFVTLVALIAAPNRKRNVLILVAPIVIGLIYSGPFFKLLGVPNTDSIREMMSVPSQQLARVYVFDRASLSEDEQKQIEEYYEIKDFVQYETFTAKADKTKNALNGEKVEEAPLKYAMLWLKIGVTHPKAYVEAFLLNSLGTWYPNKQYNDPRSDIPYIDYEMSRLWSEQDGQFAEMKIGRKSVLPLYDKLLSGLFYKNGWQMVPLYANVISMGTYFILTVFLLAMIIYRKAWSKLLPMSLVISNYIIVLLAPVAIFRYCYPMIIVAPIMITMLLLNHKKVGKEHKNGQGRSTNSLLQ